MSHKYLRDIAVFADSEMVEHYKGGFVQRFHRESCSATEGLIYYLARELQTDGVAKVNITFDESNLREGSIIERKRIAECLLCRATFDFAQYLGLAEYLPRAAMLA